MRIKLPKNPAFKKLARNYPAMAVLFILAVSVSSCEKKTALREYDEMAVDTTAIKSDEFQRIHAPFFSGEADTMGASSQSDEMKEVLSKSVSSVPLAWDVPEGWVEEEGNGMRLVTFHPEGSKQAMECSITSLSGESGGLKANAMRWIGQLKLTVLPEEEVNAFLEKAERLKSAGNLEYAILDFTKLQESSGPQTPSMISAVLELPESTVFIKMSGSKEAVSSHRDKFKSLCRSLRLKNE